MLNIYDNRSRQLVIGPFSYSRFHNVDRWLAKSDDFIRQVSIRKKCTLIIIIQSHSYSVHVDATYENVKPFLIIIKHGFRQV